MGYTPYYQAIPEGSRLFSRLRADRRLATLMDAFFPSGSRPLDPDEAGPEEVAETLEAVVETAGELFGSSADAEQALDELRAEIARAEMEHPGVVRRTAFLDKSQNEIEDRLVQHLSAREHGDTRALIPPALRGIGFCGGVTGAPGPLSTRGRGGHGLA